MDSQEYRDRLIERATHAFTEGRLDTTAYEELVVQLNAQPDLEKLALFASNQPTIFGPDALSAEKADSQVSWQDITLNMGSDKKLGEWVRAEGYRISGRMSNFELDLSAYEDAEGFRLSLDLDLQLSNIKLRVPDGWQVDCRIDDNTASNIKVKGSTGIWGDNLITIRGVLHMSNIKVKFF